MQYFYEEARYISDSSSTSKRKVERARDLFSEVTNQMLDFSSSEHLKKFLYEHFVNPHWDMQCVITESSERRLFLFPMGNHPAINLLEEGYKPILEGAAPMSRKIFLVKGEDKVDSGLRLRLALNNGVRALLGVSTGGSKKKKHSYVVAKLQQDNVPNLVEQSKAKVYKFR